VITTLGSTQQLLQKEKITYSLAAKEEESPSLSLIQSQSEICSYQHSAKKIPHFLGFILCLWLLLHGPASWLPSFESQNRVWEKIEITAKPAQNLALQPAESQQTKVNLDYDIASGSSVYCNGDPVNGLDPDGRCVEGMVTGQSYNIPSYAGALMGRTMPMFSTTQQLFSTAQSYNANYETFGESHWNAINTTFNPAYAMIKGGYEATTGFGMSPNNLGQDLSAGQRINSGVESVFGAVGTVSIAFGGASLGNSLTGGAVATTEAGIIWPPNRGFLKSPNSGILQPGSIVNRFGGNSGIFVAPEGTSFGARSLPAEFAGKSLNAFEVVKPIDVEAGVSAPWFEGSGGGVQFELPQTVQELIDSGHLQPVKN
jgi:hypothetical protein